MMPLLLVVAAAVALAWPWIRDHWHEIRMPNWRPDGRHIAAAALVAAAMLTYVNKPGEATPAPVTPEAGLDLRGRFVGPSAALDAATVAALCRELADELEWDGRQSEPFYRTGVAFDELRVRTRILRCRGESLGDRHPLARDAIEAYLNAAAGTSGGPLTPEARGKWIAAYREVGRAAEAAAR